VMRDAGQVIMEAVGHVQVVAASGARVANPNGRHPGGRSNLLIRTHSSSLLAGTKDIYLVINTDGEVMDAVVTESEDFSPIEGAKYGSLPILALDVSGGQYRKLLKLAKQLQTVVKQRPVYRPSRGAAIDRYGSSTIGSIYGSRASHNPAKKRLMR